MNEINYTNEQGSQAVGAQSSQKSSHAGTWIFGLYLVAVVLTFVGGSSSHGNGLTLVISGGLFVILGLVVAVSFFRKITQAGEEVGSLVKVFNFFVGLIGGFVLFAVSFAAALVSFAINAHAE